MRTEPRALLERVTSEVGRLLGAQQSNMVAFESDAIVVMGGWAEPEVPVIPAGTRLPFDSPTVADVVRRTGRPARVDDYDEIPGELAQRLREFRVRRAVAAPIIVGGRMWGAIVLSMTADRHFADGDEERLGSFTELVAQAIANAQAYDELAASRARLVETADRERKRLERNLHDGAQQRLVSAALRLRLAKPHVDEQGAEHLAVAVQELEQALEETVAWYLANEGWWRPIREGRYKGERLGLNG
jgi:GAF domain-containing protein